FRTPDHTWGVPDRRYCRSIRHLSDAASAPAVKRPGKVLSRRQSNSETSASSKSSMQLRGLRSFWVFLIIPAVELIVGLQFYPFPPLYRPRANLVTGACIVVWTIACLLLFHGDSLI